MSSGSGSLVIKYEFGRVRYRIDERNEGFKSVT